MKKNHWQGRCRWWWRTRARAKNEGLWLTVVAVINLTEACFRPELARLFSGAPSVILH